jgi:hypothetical protein
MFLPLFFLCFFDFIIKTKSSQISLIVIFDISSVTLVECPFELG